jgi:hypothetical protein
MVSAAFPLDRRCDWLDWGRADGVLLMRDVWEVERRVRVRAAPLGVMV